MKENVKNRMILVSVLGILFGLGAWALLRAPDSVSAAERRQLAQPPALTAHTLRSGDFGRDTDAYMADQFPLRERFRTVAAGVRLYVFRQRDTNGIYYVDGAAYQIEFPYNAASVRHAAERIGAIANTLPETVNAYLAIIPDKNYYAARQNGYPSLDYKALFSTVHSALPSLERIDLTGCLSKDDFYRTDTHWRQERLRRVYEKLAADMGLDAPYGAQGFVEREIDAFYGVLYGRGALPLAPDRLTIMENSAISCAAAYNLETGETSPVYMPERIGSIDPYDVYLFGAAAFVEINNPVAQTDRELVLFRDSFGSSLAPLLIGSYRRITLIDTRYFHPALLEQYITFDRQDVLFLYSTLLLNNSDALR